MGVGISVAAQLIIGQYCFLSTLAARERWREELTCDRARGCFEIKTLQKIGFEEGGSHGILGGLMLEFFVTKMWFN